MHLFSERCWTSAAYRTETWMFRACGMLSNSGIVMCIMCKIAVSGGDGFFIAGVVLQVLKQAQFI